MDYVSDVHTFMVAANYNPLPRLSFNGGASYSIADSKIQSVSFSSDPHTDGDRLDTATGWKGTYDVANNNEMESFSNLDYTVWDINVGASYAINDYVGVNVTYLYTDVDDQDQYVYGDESGQYQSLMTYLTFRF
jgi:opacity protein-like surface antigen